MSLLGPFMFKLINYKEKTNNPVNCLIRLGLYAHSVNSGTPNAGRNSHFQRFCCKKDFVKVFSKIWQHCS